MYGKDYLIWKEARAAAKTIQSILDDCEPEVAFEARKMLRLEKENPFAAMRLAQLLNLSQRSQMNLVEQSGGVLGGFY